MKRMMVAVASAIAPPVVAHAQSALAEPISTKRCDETASKRASGGSVQSQDPPAGHTYR